MNNLHETTPSPVSLAAPTGILHSCSSIGGFLPQSALNHHHQPGAEEGLSVGQPSVGQQHQYAVKECW